MTRPTKIFNKHPRRRTRPTGNLRSYRREASAEYRQALEKSFIGSSGAASRVRRIDPKTGAIIAAVDSDDKD